MKVQTEKGEGEKRKIASKTDKNSFWAKTLNIFARRGGGRKGEKWTSKAEDVGII